jgi:HlyD family secretion protein
MSENPLFRKAALDKLASPERLDVLMRVTSPMGWLALTAVGGILIGVIVWSILGSIPERIQGQGVLIRGGANKEIRALGSGIIGDLNLATNQVVSVGQVVGTITAAGNNEEVNVARTRLQGLENQRMMTSSDSAGTIAAADAQIARLNADVAQRRLDLQRAQAEVARLEPLFAANAITAQRMEGARQQVSSVQSQITGLQGQIAAEETRIRGARSSPGGLDGQIAVARAELDRLIKRLGAQESIKSEMSGRVIDIRKSRGDTVQQGDVVAVLEDTTATVQVVAFVAADVGKRLRKGMETEVSPSQVKREEFGFMLAKVDELGEFLASKEAVMNRMRSAEITDKLMGRNGVIEVKAALIPAQTKSGFRWSTSDGPGFKIDGGSLVSIDIVVERKAPITMVMPFLKKTFGVA